jgi:hypothetical protein
VNWTSNANWVEIDRRANNDDMKEKPHTATFAVSKSPLCRYILLTQTGESHGDNDYLAITDFEVFGTLLE